MQPDRDNEFVQQCFDAGINTAPLVPQFQPILSLHSGAPFYRVDCALQKRNGSLLHPSLVRSIARRQFALQGRSGELERWLLDRCLQLAATPDAMGAFPRLCFWLTPSAGYDALVTRLLSLERGDPSLPLVVGIPLLSHYASVDASVAVSLTARQAGLSIAVGCQQLEDCDAEVLGELRPVLVEVPAQSLLTAETNPACGSIRNLQSRGVEVIAAGMETSQQLVRLEALGVTYVTGAVFGSGSLRMDFDFVAD